MTARRIVLRTIRGIILLLPGYAIKSNDKRKKVLIAESPLSHSKDAQKVAATISSDHYNDFVEIPHGFPAINHVPSIEYGPAQKYAHKQNDPPMPEVGVGDARLFPLESLPVCISDLFHPQYEPHVLVINHSREAI